MAITLAQPSLLLNSYAFDDFGLGSSMKMEISWQCPKIFHPENLVNWIDVAYKQTPAHHLYHIVLNFHGLDHKIFIGLINPGHKVGGTYIEDQYFEINPYNVKVFGALKGKNIGTIWLHSCSVAETFIGKYLCQQMAVLSGCKVVAAEQDQIEMLQPWASLPLLRLDDGDIDNYEGPVYIWNAKGNRSRFYPNDGNWS